MGLRDKKTLDGPIRPSARSALRSGLSDRVRAVAEVRRATEVRAAPGQDAAPAGDVGAGHVRRATGAPTSSHGRGITVEAPDFVGVAAPPTLVAWAVSALIPTFALWSRANFMVLPSRSRRSACPVARAAAVVVRPWPIDSSHNRVAAPPCSRLLLVELRRRRGSSCGVSSPEVERLEGVASTGKSTGAGMAQLAADPVVPLVVRRADLLPVRSDGATPRTGVAGPARCCTAVGLRSARSRRSRSACPPRQRVGGCGPFST